MKQAPVEKYTIAFFRLAEYVSRGEKERALGVYRLLSHSFDDLAFARQLEGDILLAFNDEAAQEKYFQAAQLYQKDMRLRQAVGVYEHLLMLHPKGVLYLVNLIDLYCQLDMHAKAKAYATQLLDLAISHVNVPIISQSLISHESLFSSAESALRHEKFVYIIVKSKFPDSDLIQEHCKRVIDYCIELNRANELAQFFTMIHALDGAVYLQAHNYYKSKR